MVTSLLRTWYALALEENCKIKKKTLRIQVTQKPYPTHRLSQYLLLANTNEHKCVHRYSVHVYVYLYCATRRKWALERNSTV